MRRGAILVLGLAMAAANTGCNSQSASAPTGSSSISGATTGNSGGFWQGLLRAAATLLSGSSGTTGTTSGTSGTTGFTSQTQGGANPSSWLQAFGPGSANPQNTGGTPFGDPGSSNIQPSGRVFQVIASSFGPQTIAGSNWENGANSFSSSGRGVALPSRRGLGQFVAVRYNGNVAMAKVIDVGPWATNDPYWEGSGTPEAEGAQGTTRTGTTEANSNGNLTRQSLKVNGAGIDLTYQTWADLGVSTRSVLDRVEWWFVSEAEAEQWRQTRTGGKGSIV